MLLSLELQDLGVNKLLTNYLTIYRFLDFMLTNVQKSNAQQYENW
jgi:hypothetical protein